MKISTGVEKVITSNERINCFLRRRYEDGNGNGKGSIYIITESFTSLEECRMLSELEKHGLKDKRGIFWLVKPCKREYKLKAVTFKYSSDENNMW